MDAPILRPEQQWAWAGSPLSDEAKKALQAQWNAAAPFPCANALDDMKMAITAASAAPSLKAAALMLARRGYPVFPCDPISTGQHTKAPMTKAGFYAATTDEMVIEYWWNDRADALIGIPTGRRVGIFVVDLDMPGYGHANEDGIKAWRELEAERGGVQTRTHSTAGGGLHQVFAYNEMRPVGLGKGRLPRGLDVRGDGGFVILPPSRLEDGRQWRVEVDNRPAAAPKWLLDLILGEEKRKHGPGRPRKPRKWNNAARDDAQRELAEACAALENAPPGTRDDLIWGTQIVIRIGSIVGGGGLDREEALTALLDAAERGGLSPKHFDKIRRAFETGVADPAEPRTFEAGEKVGDYIVNKDGRPQALLANAVTLLRTDEVFRGVFRFNTIMFAATTLKPPPRDLPRKVAFPHRVDKYDIDDVMVYLQHAGILETKTGTVGSAIETLAQDNPYNPFKEYLEGLTWDGKPRLGRLFPGYFGAAVSPYTVLTGAYFLTSIVARAYQPGCKVDYTTVLEGGQGIYKSQACRALVSEEFFAENLPNLLKKDAVEQLPGKVLIELPEIVTLIHEDIENFKAFTTRQVDRYRESYGRNAHDYPRITVFIGTTNRFDYLNDDTGARRIWGIPVGHIDIAKLKTDRDQLWAEAVHRFKAGKRWWPTRLVEQHCFVGEQAARQEHDDREEPIARWIVGRVVHDSEQKEKVDVTVSGVVRDWWAGRKGKKGFTLSEVWRDALGMRAEAPFNPVDQRRIAKCLRRLGCEPALSLTRWSLWLQGVIGL
jgi:predicted P-loop ATPase